MNRILKPVTYVLAAAYFLVDAVFIAVAKPVSDWLAKHLVLRKLRSWIRSLRPYPSLALFSVPVIILEPVKPIAAYLAATGQIMSSVLTLIVGELLKLVLIERLFSLTRDKLMKIPAFAWAYTKFQQAKAWLEATEAWQAIRTLSRAARNYVAQMKRSGLCSLASLKVKVNRPDVLAGTHLISLPHSPRELLIGKRKQCLAGSDGITGEGRSERIENISKHGHGVS